MAQVTYTPPQADPAVGSALRAFEQTDSMMKRATQMRWQAEDRRKEEAQFIAMQPVLRAQREANIVNAQATVENAANVQRLRAQFGVAAPAAQSEYEAAMKLPTYREQQTALSNLQQKYSWFQLIPEGKSFAEVLANSRVFASQSALADQKLNNDLKIQEEMTERGIEVAKINQAGLNQRNQNTVQGAAERARINAENRKAIANIKEPIARIREANRLADELAMTDPLEAGLLRDYATRISQPMQSGSDDFDTFMGDSPTPTPAPAVTPRPTAIPNTAPAPTTPGANPPAKAPSTQEVINSIKF